MSITTCTCRYNDNDNDKLNEQAMIDMIKDETTRDATIPAAFLLGKDG